MNLSLKALFVAALALSLSACSKTADTNTTTVVDAATMSNEARADSMINGIGGAMTSTEGPAETAGKKIDAATERADDKMDAAANQADAALHKTGRAIDRAKKAARQTAADAKANAEAAADQ